MVVPTQGRREPAYPQQGERTPGDRGRRLGAIPRVKDGIADVRQTLLNGREPTELPPSSVVYETFAQMA